MSEKKRYLVSSRYNPQLDPNTARELEDFVASREEVELVKKTPVGRYVIEANEDEIRDLAAKNPHLIFEEDQPLDMFPMPGLPDVVSAGERHSREVIVKDANDGSPLEDVTIYGIGSGPAYKAVTDAKGKATLSTNEAELTRVIASPRRNYWSRVVQNINMNDKSVLEINLKPLLVTGAYSWGHQLMGFGAVNRYWTGQTVKIGIIDSGIVSDLEDVRPLGGYNTLDGEDPTAWNIDDEGHGTFCAGVVAAQKNAVGVLGGAPNAEVYSIKVFPGGYASDLVEAVEWCIKNRMDVINMSLGMQTASQSLANALRDAYERGITCIAAAGNDSTRVAYPAAFPTVIGIGAIGRFGTFPEDSAHALKVGNETDWRKQLFSASFTNFGPEINVCAPGVAILSTMPNGYVCWDGTSFSSPLVAALAALVLEACPVIRTGNSGQPEYLRSIIQSSAINLGLSRSVQGSGLPLARRALSFASAYYSPYRATPYSRAYSMPYRGTPYGGAYVYSF